MPKPAATKFDEVTATDFHRCQGAMVKVPFDGCVIDKVATTVLIEKVPAGRVHSVVTNYQPHTPPPGKTFDIPPANQGIVYQSLGKNVMVENWPIARDGDPVKTCDDTDAVNGVIVAEGSVLVGDE